VGRNARGLLAILVVIGFGAGAAGCPGGHTEKSPEKSAKRLAIANDYLAKGDLEGAEGEATKAIAYNTGNDEAYVVRGLVSYVRALQAKKSMEVDNCLTGVDAEAMGKDIDMFLAKADQDFERATKAAPDNGEAWADRGIVHNLLEDFTAAQEFLTKALENPMRLKDPGLTRANLGWSYFHQKKLVEATKELLTVGQFQPKMCVATYRLGRVYFAREEWEKAAEKFQTVSDDPSCGSQEASYYLMKTQMQQGLVDNAKASQATCLKLTAKSCIATKCRVEGP
jgi:tetratricopeptide (TPR) repeat protein